MKKKNKIISIILSLIMMLAVGILSTACDWLDGFNATSDVDWLYFDVDFNLGQSRNPISENRANRIMDNWNERVGDSIESILEFGPFIARQESIGTQEWNSGMEELDGVHNVEVIGVTESDGSNIFSKMATTTTTATVFSELTYLYYYYNNVLRSLWMQGQGDRPIGEPTIVEENNLLYFMFVNQVFSSIAPLGGPGPLELYGSEVYTSRNFVWGIRFSNGYAFRIDIDTRIEMASITSYATTATIFIFNNNGYLVEHMSVGYTSTETSTTETSTTRLRMRTKIEYTKPTIDWPDFVTV